MRYLEVRRHSKRRNGQARLSQEGVSLARRIGSTLGHFDRVVTSTEPRAYDTAIAMGYAVDMELEQLVPFGNDVCMEVDFDASFVQASLAVKRGKVAAAYAREMAKFWRELALMAHDGGTVLVICHGGVIELGAIGCLPHAEHGRWGAAAGFCEGVRLAFDGERFADVELLRIGND